MKIEATHDSLLNYMKGTGEVTMAALGNSFVANMRNRGFNINLGGCFLLDLGISRQKGEC
jgi:hypothetical protein